MSAATDVPALLDEFRAARRGLQRRYTLVPSERRTVPPAPGQWSARDILAHIAAWIEEANDRIPRLLAGAPSLAYDLDAFNAAAVARAAEWTGDQTLAAFRRAADRFEAIVGGTDAADIVDAEEALAWLRATAHDLMHEHFAELERLADSDDA